MDPNQQQLLLTTGGKKSTYVDDVFSTYLYRGNETSININNGIDILGDGGLFWTCRRDSTSYGHYLFDTDRGAEKYINTTSDAAEITNSATVSSFNNNGVDLGNSSYVNSPDPWGSWTFRKQKGFFDIVKYTGTGSTATLNHNLGCVPGMMIVKALDDTSDWRVFHRSAHSDPQNYGLTLNGSTAVYGVHGDWGNTMPTATQFTVGGNFIADTLNYVCYLFAGGESTADTARSVEFDGSGDYLTVAGPGALGTSTDFTMECWVYLDNLSGLQRIFSANEGADSDEATQIRTNGTNWNVYLGRNGSSDYWNFNGGNPVVGQWTHLALVRNGSNNAFYVNGVLESSGTGSHDTTITTLVVSGGYGSENLDGKVSNARFVNGTAVYTSTFTPPTEPLTSITNTSLLCCNNSSTTGKTTGGTITANGDPTASTDSPFDDPKGFLFGEEGDQNLIKTGSYVGNNSSDGPIVNLGWEPQYLIVKAASSTGSWILFDRMRGLSGGGVTDNFLQVNSTAVEVTNLNCIDITSRSFQPKSSDSKWNASNVTYIYIAIRSQDGYVGKPAEAGTDVFNMIAGTSSADIPTFVSGIPVDYSLLKNPGGSGDWYSQARLTGTNYSIPNSTAAQATSAPNKWDFMNGWYNSAGNFSNYQSWMWKQGQGFEVGTYIGDGVGGRQIPHSLGRTPEMIWIKARTQSSGRDWQVGHIGINGGTSPWNGFIKLNSTGVASAADNQVWNSTAPTSTAFTIGTGYAINHTGYRHVAMLFASVAGISKCGYWSGDGTSNDSKVITTGFTPRFVIIKRTTVGAGNWLVIDTLRGFTKYLRLSLGNAEDTQTFITTTSTGFTISSSDSDVNASGSNYIYYAHA